MIVVEKLSKSFGKKQVLKDINIELAPGYVYGIVGKNGAGKTTLFNCLAGIETYSGRIISEYKPLKNYIGYLETNPVMLKRITGWEYLKLYSVARKLDYDDFQAHNIFDLPLNQYCSTYSTGMKKKLAFMAILFQKNDIYILDEPFNGVDIQSNIILIEVIKRLKAANKTVIISSHIFSTLRQTCDKIYPIKNGRIDESVLPEDYDKLESNMHSEIIGKNVDKLFL